jgi:hypothetical protein
LSDLAKIDPGIGSTRPVGRRAGFSDLARIAVRRVIILCTSLLILSYLLFFGLGAIPQAADLFVPAVLLGTCLLLSSLTTLFLVGRLVPNLRNGLLLLGIGLFIGTLLISLNGSNEGLAAFGVSVIALSGLLFLACIVQGYHERIWIVMRGITLMGIGLVLWFSTSLQASSGEGLGTALLLSFILSGLLSLLGLYYDHQNKSLRMLGETFRPTLNILLLSGILPLFFLYLYIFRPMLQASNAANVILIEWLAIGLITAMVAIRFYLYFRRNSEMTTMGNWTVLMQKVSFEEGDLRKATVALKGFIDAGKKDGIVVLLTSTLLINQISQERIGQILWFIINYQAPEVSLLFRWTYGDLQLKLREERIQIVTRALADMADVVGLQSNPGGAVGRQQRVQEA